MNLQLLSSGLHSERSYFYNVKIIFGGGDDYDGDGDASEKKIFICELNRMK